MNVAVVVDPAIADAALLKEDVTLREPVWDTALGDDVDGGVAAVVSVGASLPAGLLLDPCA